MPIRMASKIRLSTASYLLGQRLCLETQRRSSLSKVLAPVTRIHTQTTVALLPHLRGADLANAFEGLDALVKSNKYSMSHLAYNKASCL